MRTKHLYLLFGFLFIYLSVAAHTSTITGRVIDASNKQSLPGAVVSIPDLRISTVTDKDGRFFLKNVPDKGRFLAEVRFIGYRTLTQTVDFSTAQDLEFILYPSVLEAKEVVVTGSAFSTDDRKNSTNVTAVGKADLLNRPSTNLIDAISKVPGVAQVTTGASVSKPVIRGLSYNRVVTLANGTKQEGQQWGDEHGIEVDQFGADRVEILRGAASLLYGSDAIGGVINILDPLPAALGQIRGEVLTNYASNNGLTGNSIMVEGNNDGFVWRGRGSYKNAFSYDTPEGRIANTGFTELNLSGQLGVNKKWGYTTIDFSTFKSELGLPDFERNDAGDFLDGDGNTLSSQQLKRRKLLLPFQDVRHHKLALNSNILIGTGRLRSNIAYQDNQRRELEESPSEPSLFFDLQTYSYDLKYYFQEKWGWEPVIGVAGSFQTNENKAEELLVPDYSSTDFGMFGYGKKTWNNVTTFSIGARFDYRTIAGDEMFEDAEQKFTAFTNTFSNISGALGFTQEFNDQWSFKANLGSAFRAPNIAELSSNGIHEGTFRYEIGNTALEPEQSFYGDVAVEFAGEKASATISVFNNYINHYIYYRQVGNETIMVDNELFPVFRYTQDNANLYGIEAGITLHPLEVLHFENAFSFTRGENRATKVPLPFIPAASMRNELRIEPKFRRLKQTYFSLELDNVFRQNRIDIFETTTRAYTLLNAAAGTTLMLNKQPLKVTIAATNLLNKAYVNHLSRLKYEGILNQGRNVSVGLYLPFVFN